MAAIVRQRELDNDVFRNIEPEAKDEWRTNPYHGYVEHVASQRVGQPLVPANTELKRWFREPVVDVKISPASLKTYMQSKAHEFPIIC